MNLLRSLKNFFTSSLTPDKDAGLETAGKHYLVLGYLVLDNLVLDNLAGIFSDSEQGKAIPRHLFAEEKRQ